MDSSLPPNDCESDPSCVIFDESDDEETIAQEESLEPEIDPEEELRILASDLDVSLEELTAQCSSPRSRRIRKKVDYKVLFFKESLTVIREFEERQNKQLKDMEVKENEAGPSTTNAEVEYLKVSVSPLTKFYLTRTLINEDEDKDADFNPLLISRFNQEIRVGPSYQADVPEGPIASTSAAKDTDEESGELLWKPSQILSEEDVEAYQSQINEIVQQATSQKVQHCDNKQALKILLHCDYNQELALQHFKENLQEYLNRENAENHIDISKRELEKEVNCTRKVENEDNDLVPSPLKIEKEVSCTREIEDEDDNLSIPPSKIPRKEDTKSSEF